MNLDTNTYYYEEGFATLNDNERWVSVDNYGHLSFSERSAHEDEHFALFIRNEMLSFYTPEDNLSSQLELLDSIDTVTIYEQDMSYRYKALLFASRYDLEWAISELNKYIKQRIEDSSLQKLYMYPDFGNECFWYAGDGAVFDMEEFNLQKQNSKLYTNIKEWVQEFQKHEKGKKFNWDAFNKKGKYLHHTLQLLVAEKYYIEYTISHEEKDVGKTQ